MVDFQLRQEIQIRSIYVEGHLKSKSLNSLVFCSPVSICSLFEKLILAISLLFRLDGAVFSSCSHDDPTDDVSVRYILVQIALGLDEKRDNSLFRR